MLDCMLEPDDYYYSETDELLSEMDWEEIEDDRPIECDYFTGLDQRVEAYSRRAGAF